MANKLFGIADPYYDALRVQSNQAIWPDAGGSTSGLGGVLENKIYVWHADGSTIDTFDPTEAGLVAALAAAASGDTVWLPSIPITLSGTLTVQAGIIVRGLSWESILIGTVVNNGALENIRINGNVTNGSGARLERVYIANSSGTGIAQAAQAVIDRCFVQTGTTATYGIDISAGYCFQTIVATDGGTTSMGVYCHGANAELQGSRFAGYIGGKVEQAYIVSNCEFYGSAVAPDTGSNGLIHTTTGTAPLSACTFICQSSNSFGLYVTASGLTLTDCAWNSISGLANISYGTGDRSPLNHTHSTIPNIIVYVSGDISNPPTEAELESLCGTPASVGAGAAFVVRDTSTNRYYLAISDGAQFVYSPFISSTAGGGGSTTFQLVASGAHIAPGWCWFADARAIYYNGHTYLAYTDSDGDIYIRTYTHSTHIVSAPFDLHGALQIDDHTNPSILIRNSDKKILASYSQHGGTTIYLRISSNAEDVTAWGSEASLDAQIGGNLYTYPSLIQLTGEASQPIYLFFRDHSTGLSEHPAHMGYSKSTDGGATWSAETLLALMTYHKLAANGTTRIDFAGSNHPADPDDHGIYHFYYSGGNFYKSDGTLITATLPMATSDMTQVYDGSSVSAWIWDIAIDGTGKPIIVYATFPTTTDHRYNYARWTGSAWDKHEITAAGGTIDNIDVNAEFYSGGVVLDHDDPQIVYLSKVVSGQFEIYKYTTADGGATWSNTAITSGSSGKQIRPVAIRNHASDLKFLWLSGTYTSFTSWNLALLGSP